jgi:predicted dehydrogenase
VQRVTCYIGGAPTSGPFKKKPPPPELNWDLWLGQAPKVDYIPQRVHREFRWWYEYSGGKLTDWGTHHVDIAQWAIGMDHSGPTLIEPQSFRLPVPFKDGRPTVDNAYNTPTEFRVRCQFPNGIDVFIERGKENDNGILFEGTAGRFHVSRPRDNHTGLRGLPFDELKTKPLPDGLITQIYNGKQPGNHMGNFIECVKTREQPISDVFTHHRAVTTCHLANIAMRLNRTLHWDPETEQITGDPEAQKWLSREQRKGFETNA